MIRIHLLLFSSSNYVVTSTAIISHQSNSSGHNRKYIRKVLPVKMFLVISAIVSFLDENIYKITVGLDYRIPSTITHVL